jgi:hypothetical protein
LYGDDAQKERPNDVGSRMAASESLSEKTRSRSATATGASADCVRRRNRSFSLSPVRGRWQPDPDEPRGSKFPAVGIVTCSNHAPGLTTEEEPARQAPIETGVDEKGPGRVRALVAQSSQSSHASCVLSSSSCTSSSS